jgi:transposase
VFWKPIFNILESRFSVLLVNPQHLKRVPGRKTDIKDCQWIAQLLQYGLLQGSFVPPRKQRELRDLTRHRAQLTEERTRIINRIHKVLEDANLKLGSVASDVLGVSGRAMIEALLEGEEDPRQLADLAQRQLRGKIPELERALRGRVTEHHRFMLRLLWKQLKQMEAMITHLEARIKKVTRPFVPQVEQMSEVPGIQVQVAQVVLAEVGADVQSFPTHHHLASWSGICPGNEESAGKRRSGRITPGNRWLKRALVQAAWAASRTKHTYLAAQYRRLATRRGRKRALVAVAHSILVIVYHLLKDNSSYRDLGGDFFDRLEPERLTRYYVKRLQRLGHKVTLEPCSAA